MNPGGVTVVLVPSARFRSSIPRCVSSATRTPSGANAANVQSVRISPGRKRSAAGRQCTESRGCLRRTASVSSGNASAAPVMAPLASSSRLERFRLNGGSD